MDLELLNAARSGNTQKIIQLADVGERSINDETTPEGNTVLHMAARFGHMQLVEEIVKRHPSLVLKSNLMGQTPVHIAARAGRHDVVQSFIKSMENFSRVHIARARDTNGNTPLHGAVRNGHYAAVKALADHDKESLRLINDAGESPLSIAIDMSFTEITKLITSLNESTLEFTGHNGQTALHYAVLRNDSDIMKVILKLKKDLVRVQDEKKRTPLHYAAVLGYQTMVENLLQVNHSVAYEKDKNQQIPVHLAAELNGQISLIKMLLDRCPDTIEIVDNKQRNILHLAAKSGYSGLVSHILKSDEMEDLINSPDADGNTPLHLASINYHRDVVCILLKNPKVKIKAINKSNKTALAMVKSLGDCGMKIQKHLTFKALKSAYKQRATNPEDILENLELDDVEKANKYSNEKGREIAKIIYLMSTIIATFTFTASFALPGGFNNGGTGTTNRTNSTDEGMATLIDRPAFQAFVISDAIAMTSSIIAAVIVFWSTSRRDTESFMVSLPFAIGSVWISVIAMSVAFVTGLFVVLQKKRWLAILVCVIGFAAPVCLYIVAPISLVENNPLWFIIQSIAMFVQGQTQNLFMFVQGQTQNLFNRWSFRISPTVLLLLSLITFLLLYAFFSR